MNKCQMAYTADSKSRRVTTLYIPTSRMLGSPPLTRVTLSLAYLRKKVQFLVNISFFLMGPIIILLMGRYLKRRYN